MIRRMTWLPVAALACAAAVVSACSSSSGGTTNAPAGANPQGAQPSGAAGIRGQFGGAAASGEIAQRSGSTLQVQSSSDQTAVTFSTTTKFTIAKATTRSAVTVGSCVVAMSTQVRIAKASNGSCTARGGMGGGPGGGARPSGAPNGMPTGARPSGAPTGMPSGMQNGGGTFAAGKVTAVGASSITVTMNGTKRTIATTSKTTYTITTATTAAAATVGRCATVQGKTNSRGAVAATSIALSSKTNGTCTSGFGGPPGGNGNG